MMFIATVRIKVDQSKKSEIKKLLKKWSDQYLEKEPFCRELFICEPIDCHDIEIHGHFSQKNFGVQIKSELDELLNKHEFIKVENLSLKKLSSRANAQGREQFWSSQLKKTLTQNFNSETEWQNALRVKMEERGFPTHMVLGPDEGRVLYQLLRLQNPKSVLELGTHGGYSASWILRALSPGAKMVGIELDETRVDFARSELTAFAKQRAVEFSVVQSEIEPMLESFQANGESFDFVFIDADKLKSDFYVRWAWENLPPNGLILLDNAFLFGAIEEENVELIEGARPRVTRQNRQSFQNIWDFVRSSEEVDFTFIPTGEGMLLIQRSLDGRE